MASGAAATLVAGGSFPGGLALVTALLARCRVGRPSGGLLLGYYGAYWVANYVV